MHSASTGGDSAKRSAQPSAMSMLDEGNLSLSAFCTGCDSRWCLSCESNNHFPALCDDMAFYDEFIRKAGSRKDFKEPPKTEQLPAETFVVEVKDCPFCATPWQKIDGCDHIVCRKCSQQFCWHCLRPWQNHDFNACRKSKAEFRKVEIQDISLSNHDWLMWAGRMSSHEELCRNIKTHEKLEKRCRLFLSDKKLMKRVHSQMGRKCSKQFAEVLILFLAEAHALLHFAWVWMFAAKYDETRNQHAGSPFMFQATFYIDKLDALTGVANECTEGSKSEASKLAQNQVLIEVTMRAVRRYLIYFAGETAKQAIERVSHPAFSKQNEQGPKVDADETKDPEEKPTARTKCNLNACQCGLYERRDNADQICRCGHTVFMHEVQEIEVSHSLDVKLFNLLKLVSPRFVSLTSLCEALRLQPTRKTQRSIKRVLGRLQVASQNQVLCERQIFQNGTELEDIFCFRLLRSGEQVFTFRD